MIARWFLFIRIITAWLIGMALTLIIVLLWHELLIVFVVDTLHWDRYAVPLAHILYYITAGLAWVGFFIFHLEYLNRCAGEGRLLEAASRPIGAQLLIIALGQAGMTLYGYFPADAFGIVLLAGEGLAGAGMLILAGRMRMRRKSIQTVEQV